MKKSNHSKTPKSLTDIMGNPKRDYAEGALCLLLYQLEHRMEIDPSMLADVLFKYAILFTYPNDESTEENARYYWQLTRFQRDLTAQTDALREEREMMIAMKEAGLSEI